MDGLIGKLNPELIYVEGKMTVLSSGVTTQQQSTGIVPSKTSKTAKIFENTLRQNIQNAVSNSSKFPTKKEVLIIIEHGFSSEKDYQERDLDNKSKCILDALESVIYERDSQVKFLWCQKVVINKNLPNITNYFEITVKVLSTNSKRRLEKHIRSFKL